MNNKELNESLEKFKREHNERTKELIETCTKNINDLEHKISSLKNSPSEDYKDCYIDFLECAIKFYKDIISNSLIY